MTETPYGERRIEYMPLDVLIGMAHEDNPKDHDIGQLVQGILRYGFTEAPLIDEARQKMAAGHGRTKALVHMQRNAIAPEGLRAPEGIRVREDGMWLAPVQRGLSFASDNDLRAYLVWSNRSTELGGWDEVGLASVLQGLVDSDVRGLDYTGFDGDDLGTMLARLSGAFYEQNRQSTDPANDPNAEWQGMPEYDQPDRPPYHSIKVNFLTEDGMEAFAALLGQVVTRQTKYINYPYRPDGDLMKYGYITQ